MSNLSIAKIGPIPQKQFENRKKLYYTSIRKLSCDIKCMYRASTGHRFILVVTNEVTNYLVTIPLHRGTSHDVGEALINYVFENMAPSCLVFDEDQSFISSIMQYIYKRIGFKIKAPSPYSKCSSKAERQIIPRSEMIAKQLTGTGQM